MLDSSLRELLDLYVESWGPVDWSSLKNRTPLLPSPDIGRVILALALIEGDSQVMRRKLATTRADRNDVLLEFIAIWLAEEGEHSRALKHLARLFGTTSIDCDYRRPLRDLRAFVTWPVLHAARFLPGLTATYCTLGAIQESIALTTYNHVAALVDDVDCKEVLRRIAVQEAGHMRFYRHAARLLLSESRIAQLATSALIKQLWRPPGMDLLGPKVFSEIFAPLLSTRRYTDALASLDRTISQLPGLGNVKIISNYLQSTRFV
jgi:hypothetical protein